MGTHLRVLSKRYPMNTCMIGFREALIKAKTNEKVWFHLEFWELVLEKVEHFSPFLLNYIFVLFMNLQSRRRCRSSWRSQILLRRWSTHLVPSSLKSAANPNQKSHGKTVYPFIDTCSVQKQLGYCEIFRSKYIRRKFVYWNQLSSYKFQIVSKILSKIFEYLPLQHLYAQNTLHPISSVIWIWFNDISLYSMQKMIFILLINAKDDIFGYI